jgi:tetratricopeptide (TPR) repeat protein
MRSWHQSKWAAAVAGFEEAVSAYQSLGDIRSAAEMLANSGAILADVGMLDESLRRQTAALELAEKFDLSFVRAGVLANLSLLYATRGDVVQARLAGERAIELCRQQGDRRTEGFASTHLAIAALHGEEFKEAERYSRSALEALASVPPLLPSALGCLAASLLGQNRVQEASTYSREAHRMLLSMGEVGDGEMHVFLVHAHCLVADGDLHGARSVLSNGCARLVHQAAQFESPAWRDAFLALPRNARVIALAKCLGVH